VRREWRWNSAAAARLESAIRARNPELAESAIFQAFSVLHPVHVPALILLAEGPWHQRHEDVVRAIQQLRSPDAVDALERTAFSVHEYLAYDEDFSLARKCAWALADIGTPEAQHALGRLAACNNSIIASYAQKRLDNWGDELHRKGHSHSTTVSQPTPPYFSWNSRHHYFKCFSAADAAAAAKRVSRLNLVREYDSTSTIYDSEGTAWGFHYVGRKERFSLRPSLSRSLQSFPRVSRFVLQASQLSDSGAKRLHTSMVSPTTMTS
jgi:hypothetical protein